MNTPVTADNKNSRPWVAGAILILIGVIFLIERFLDFPGHFILPSLAVIFLAWGLMARSTGLLIPGGILSGLSAAILLLQGPLAGLTDHPMAACSSWLFPPVGC